MLVNIRIDFKIADVGSMENSYAKLDALNEKIHNNVKVLEEVTLKTCNRYEIYLILEEDINIPTTTFIVEKDDNAINQLFLP